MNRDDELMYAIGHDLAAPVRHVRNLSHLLAREDNLSQQAQELLEHITSAGDRLSAMVEGMLEISRVGRVEEPMVALPMEAAIGQAMREMGPTWAESGATFEGGGLPRIHAEPRQTVTLWRHLLDNAVRHGGSVHVKVEVRDEDGLHRFDVIDNGPGIRKGQEEAAVRLFRTLGNTGGQGIGLALCRRIALRHGGDLWVEPRSKGTQIAFTWGVLQ